MENHFKSKKTQSLSFVVTALFMYCQINRKGRWLSIELQVSQDILFCTNVGVGQNLT